MPSVCFAGLLLNSENIEGGKEGTRGKETIGNKQLGETVGTQIITQIFLQEAMCLERIRSFLFIPRKMQYF